MTNYKNRTQDVESSSPQEPNERTNDPVIENTETKKPNFLSDIIIFSILAIFIVAPIRLFVAQPFIVSGASMEPTFETGQYLFVDQISYDFSPPKRGEVIIFRYPKDPSKFFIKRVIGLPNETVEMRGKDVIIKNKKHPSGIILDEPYLDKDNINVTNMTTVLQDNEYFALGDNRRASSDSRIWGPLPEDLIVGRPFIRLYPIAVSSLMPGDYSKSSE